MEKDKDVARRILEANGFKRQSCDEYNVTDGVVNLCCEYVAEQAETLDEEGVMAVVERITRAKTEK